MEFSCVLLEELFSRFFFKLHSEKAMKIIRKNRNKIRRVKYQKKYKINLFKINIQLSRENEQEYITLKRIQ